MLAIWKLAKVVQFKRRRNLLTDGITLTIVRAEFYANECSIVDLHVGGHQ